MENEAIVSKVLEGGEMLLRAKALGGPRSSVPEPPEHLIPGTLRDLNQAVARTYDLTLKGAASLDIPVMASVSGGVQRRVVVMEHAAYKEFVHEGVEFQYGYAIRVAITVSRMEGSTKLSFPFLAASAELGRIEGRWVMQVVGLSGPGVELVPPTELNVETFVLAKQALEKNIRAVNDQERTEFRPVRVGELVPDSMDEEDYRTAVYRAYALGQLESGRTQTQAREDLEEDLDGLAADTLTEVYGDFAGLDRPDSAPTRDIRNRARAILGHVKVSAR